jgi:hypothetical protein
MYRKTDRDNLQAIKTLLVQHVKETGGDDDICLLLNGQNTFLNELGQTVGRIESQLKNIGMVTAGLQNDFDHWPYWRNKTESILVAIKTVLDGVPVTVNRRADESLDVVRGLAARQEALDRRFMQVFEPLGELTGLLQAEVSEASSFRKALNKRIDLMVGIIGKRDAVPPKKGKGKRK